MIFIQLYRLNNEPLWTNQDFIVSMSGFCWTHLKPSWLGWHSTIGRSTTPMSPTPPRCRSTSAARPCNLKRFEVWGTGSNTRGPMMKSEGGMDMFFEMLVTTSRIFQREPNLKGWILRFFSGHFWKKQWFFLYGKFWELQYLDLFKMLFKDLAWNSSPFCSSIWGEYRAPSQVARRIYEVSTGMDWKVSAWGITTVYPIPTATTTQ